MDKEMKNHESRENYLETILILNATGIPVRAVDIAARLEFSRASVSIALKKLRDLGLVLVDSNGIVTFTPEGEVIARSVHERHSIIASWLVSIGVSAETASLDACKIEHVISEESFCAIREYLRSLTNE